MLDCQRPPKRKRYPVNYPEGSGGREVLDLKTAEGRREYYRRIADMALRQKGNCSLCGLPMRIDDCTYEHESGRGMGGGHRDDRIEINGKNYNSAAHSMCNVRKGSVRLEKYKEVA